MKNKIIVESKNDRHFMELLLANRQGLTVENIDPETEVDFSELNGLNDKKLMLKIKDILTSFRQEKIKKVGILLDQDDHSDTARINFFNKAIDDACRDTGATFWGPLEALGQFYRIDYKGSSFEVACSLVHVDGKGELTNVLKTIKNQPSDYADCLSAWKACAESKALPLKDKDFIKLWVDFYIRWDTCKKDEQKQAMKYCSMHNFDSVLQKNIFDLEHDCLQNLRSFLNQFLN